MATGMATGMGVVTGTDGQLNGSAGGKHSHTRSHPAELDVATKRTRCVRDVGDERGNEPERRADRRLVLDPPADGGAVDEFWWIAIS